MARKNRTLQERRQAYNRSRQIARQRHREYAKVLAEPKSRFKSTTSATTTKSSVKSYLERPNDNFSNIAATLRQAYTKSGVISRVIDYYTSHPTYNHSIYPVLGNKVYEIGQNMQQDYIDIAYELNALNIPFFAPYFFRETLIEGASFFYKIEDKTGVGYMKFPGEWCRISGLEDGVYRYRIDISKLKTEVYDALPSELQSAYDTYHGSGVSDDDAKWYDRKWYMVSDLGMAFTFDPNALFNGGTAISPFASVLADSLALEQSKENIDVKDQLDTVRIIHQKIPLDSNGIPTMPLETAKIYDEQMRSRLPEGTVPVTSPAQLTNIPLKGSGNEGVYASVNSGLEQLFYDLGTSAPLFGSNTTSSNIVKESVKKDANWVYTHFLPLLENYYNYEISQVKTKNKIRWNIKFIRESNFTLKDDIANYKDQLSYGGSRMDYLAACGFSPIEVISQLKFEQEALDIDSLMVVKPTSNTLSSKDVQSGHNTIRNSFNPNKGKIGRPETDNPTDDTDRLDDAQ